MTAVDTLVRVWVRVWQARSLFGMKGVRHMSRTVHWLLVLPPIPLIPAEASKILGFASTGVRSQCMNVATIGEELADRGHTFILLVTSEDALSLELMAKIAPDLPVLMYEGPPNIGSPDWASSKLRGPFPVSKIPMKMVMYVSQATAACLFLCTA